jgi:hypothetical protein
VRNFIKDVIAPGSAAKVVFSPTKRYLSARDTVEQMKTLHGGKYSVYVGTISKGLYHISTLTL